MSFFSIARERDIIARDRKNNSCPFRGSVRQAFEILPEMCSTPTLSKKVAEADVFPRERQSLPMPFLVKREHSDDHGAPNE